MTHDETMIIKREKSTLGNTLTPKIRVGEHFFFAGLSDYKTKIDAAMAGLTS